MTENRENWLYSDASGLYFPHDGFIMRATDGKQYDIDEECELLNEYHKEYNECRDDVLRLEKENEQLKEENKELKEENEQLKQFIQELTTKGTGRIDLADGYSYSASAVLTNWKGECGMTDKFYLKEVCGEYKFYEEGDAFPLTEKQILNKLNENEQLKNENAKMKKELSLLAEFNQKAIL